MLKPVPKRTKYDGGIAVATNYELEEETLGVPLWLHRNGYREQVQECARYISSQGEDLFVRHHHRMLARAYSELMRKDLPLTDGLLKSELQHLDAWSDNESDKGVITPGLLANLEDRGALNVSMRTGLVPLETLREYAAELSDLRWKRRFIHLAEELSEVAQDCHRPDFDDRMCDLLAEFQVTWVNKTIKDNAAPSPIGMLFRDDILSIEAQLSGQAVQARILTPFDELNTLTGGFLAGNLVILAGRTSMGKTALGLNIAWHTAKQDHLAAYFSLEMSKTEIIRRIASKETHIPVLELRHGDLKDFQVDIYRRLGAEKRIPCFVDDRPATPAEIEQRCQQILDIVPGGPALGLVVVDHIQLLGTRDRRGYETRHRQLSQYSAELKDLAKHFGCPVLALSQVNRASDREQRPPRLSDLRESGSIEENADIVLGIYRKAVDVVTAPKDEAQLVVIKNRNGPLGRVDLQWIPALATFKGRGKLEEAPF